MIPDCVDYRGCLNIGPLCCRQDNGRHLHENKTIVLSTLFSLYQKAQIVQSMKNNPVKTAPCRCIQCNRKIPCSWSSKPFQTISSVPSVRSRFLPDPRPSKQTPPEQCNDIERNLLLFKSFCSLGGENLLPYLHPFSLSMWEHLLWIAHYLCHDLADSDAKSLECEHLFPVSDREP